MTSPDTKALIEEARRVGTTLANGLADALEDAEVEKDRLRKVNHQDHQDNLKIVGNVVAQLQQTQARLEEARKAAYFYRSTGLLGERIPSQVDDRFLASLQDKEPKEQ